MHFASQIRTVQGKLTLLYRNFEAQATDTSFYNRDTQGKREITLSTCTNDNKIRTIILAREV